MAIEMIDEATWASAMAVHAQDNAENADKFPRARMEMALAIDEVATSYENAVAEGGTKDAMSKMGSTLGRIGVIAERFGYTELGKEHKLGDDLHRCADEIYNDGLYDLMLEHDPDTTREEVQRFGAALAGCHYVKTEPVKGAIVGNFDLVASKQVPLNAGMKYYMRGIADAIDDMKYQTGRNGVEYLAMISDSKAIKNTNLPVMNVRGVTECIAQCTANPAQATYVAKKVEEKMVSKGSFEARSAFDQAFRVTAAENGISTKGMGAPVRRTPDIGEQMSFADIDPEFDA